MDILYSVFYILADLYQTIAQLMTTETDSPATAAWLPEPRARLCFQSQGSAPFARAPCRRPLALVGFAGDHSAHVCARPRRRRGQPLLHGCCNDGRNVGIRVL